MCCTASPQDCHHPCNHFAFSRGWGLLYISITALVAKDKSAKLQHDKTCLQMLLTCPQQSPRRTTRDMQPTSSFLDRRIILSAYRTTISVCYCQLLLQMRPPMRQDQNSRGLLARSRVQSYCSETCKEENKYRRTSSLSSLLNSELEH